MNSLLIFSVFVALILVSDACVGIFPAPMGGGCGCGGGGGGGGGAMPPPTCGCMGGGRKKRSVPEKPAFFGIAAADDDLMCNTPELKKVILENMHSSATDSSKSINTALERRQLNRFVVVCSENPFVYTVRADTAYCGAIKNGHNCHAFAL